MLLLIGLALFTPEVFLFSIFIVRFNYHMRIRTQQEPNYAVY